LSVHAPGLAFGISLLQKSKSKIDPDAQKPAIITAAEGAKDHTIKPCEEGGSDRRQQEE
jgi:hypothetical protein